MHVFIHAHRHTIIITTVNFKESNGGSKLDVYETKDILQNIVYSLYEIVKSPGYNSKF